ncbi:MAG: stage 0 sporulation family protein [Andreesenia angusta]|nr:stage 0 sporulation family protein [Andreesenia angusta]
MAKVLGVRFKKAGKIYHYYPNKEEDIKVGCNVIVETPRGIEMGYIVYKDKEIEDSELEGSIEPIIRVATNRDEKRYFELESKESEAFTICMHKIKEHRLGMRLIDVEFTFDRKKVIFYFTADGRVDFRELVRDLASIFRMRIELRQIGVRDEAKLIGGIGPCGRPLCCSTFLGEFNPVTIKMAKDQDLSLNPSKISGVCGRLMCCLKNEHENYSEILENMPLEGMVVETPLGKGIVQSTSTLMELVKVKVRMPDKSEEIMPFLIQEIEFDKSEREKIKRRRLDFKKVAEAEGIDSHDVKFLRELMEED